MSDIGEMLKQYRIDNNLSLREMAKLCHLSPQTIANIESSKYVPTQKTADKLLNVMLYSNSLDDRSLYKKIPVLGNIAAGQPIMACQMYDSFVYVPADSPASFGLKVKGDSMVGAGIRDGDIVFIKQQEEVDNGEIAAVRIGDDVTLKRFFYKKNDKTVILHSENAKYHDMVYYGRELEDIHVLGKAVGANIKL